MSNLPAFRKQGMFCFWCVWRRPSIKDQGANNSFSAEVGELDQCNQSVNLSTCQPKTTAPVTYKVRFFFAFFQFLDVTVNEITNAQCIEITLSEIANPSNKTCTLLGDRTRVRDLEYILHEILD